MQSIFSYFLPSPLSGNIDSLPSEDCCSCLSSHIQTVVKAGGRVFGHPTTAGAHHVICEPCKVSWMAQNNNSLPCPICREDITWSQMEYKKSSSDDTKFVTTSVFLTDPSPFSNLLITISAIAITAIGALVCGATLFGLAFSISKLSPVQAAFGLALTCQALFITRLGFRLISPLLPTPLPSALSIATATTLYALPLIRALPLLAMTLFRNSQETTFQNRGL